MQNRLSVGAAAVMAALVVTITAAAQETKAYPDWEGMWNRGSPVGSWDPTKPPGRGQQAPLTAEYQAVLEANAAKQKTGMDYDPKATCGPVGMPRVMAMYEPMEIVIKPRVTYMIIESMSPIRRIYTDGRDWPQEAEPSYTGYSIGKWIDSTGSGGYDRLEIETRFIKGKRLYDGSGLPLADDESTIVKERLSLDKTDSNKLWNEITTQDNALTQPWTVKRFYRREHNPMYGEYNCTEDNRWIVIGGWSYLMDPQGYLMPVGKNEPAPDPQYFTKYFPTKK
jgi:hypothetical protein